MSNDGRQEMPATTAVEGRHPGLVEVALLDRDGVIVSVNHAWLAFARDNEADPVTTGVGASYLAVCEASDDPAAQEVGQAIRMAVRGDLPAPVQVLIPCHSPSEPRWFDVLVSSRLGDDGTCVGATVTLAPSPGPALDGAAARQFLDHVPDGLLLVDGRQRITFVNQHLEALTGYGRAELLGRPISALVCERARPRMLAILDTAWSKGTPPLPQGQRIELRRRDGEPRVVEMNVAPIRLEGQPMTAASIRDPGPRSRADEHARHVLDQVPDAVFVHDAAFRVEYANQTAADWLGYDQDAMLGVALSDVDHTVDAATTQSDLNGATLDDVVVRDRVLHDKQGRELPCETQMRVVADPDSAAPRFVTVARDARPQREQQQQLRVSEASFRAAFEHAPIGMAAVRVDAGGNRVILRANAALGAILGVRAEELVGREVTEFTFPEDEPRDRVIAVRMATGQQPEYARRNRYRCPDGRTVWAEMRCSVVDLPDLDGTITLVHLLDVTSRHEIERAQARHSALSRLVAAVTTDVLSGQPLEAIHRRIVQEAASAFEASGVLLALPDPAGGALRVVAVAGRDHATIGTQLSIQPDVARRLAEQGQVATHSPVGDPTGPGAWPGGRPGPCAAAHFGGPAASAGVIALCRAGGEEPFSNTDLDLLAGLARQVALAVQLGQAQVDQQRLAVLEDRERIARDLHDTVIQDLIAVGMQLNTAVAAEGASQVPSPAASAESQNGASGGEAGNRIVDQIEQAVRRLRGAVFDLRERPAAGPLSEAARGLTTGAARVLGHTPDLVVSGPVDELPQDVAEEVLAVLHEALSNVSRHARASHTQVLLVLDDGQLQLTVDDNGVGLAGASTGNGIANVRHRAAALGGRTELGPRPGGGTRLTWTCTVQPG